MTWSRLLRLFRGRSRAPAQSRMPGFDEAYYRRAYPDVAHFPGPPLQHYLRHGWKEGRDPSAGFGGDGYLAANPDVAAGGLDPLSHFLESGLAEGRTGWQKDPASPPPVPRLETAGLAPPLKDFVENTTIFMYWVNPEVRDPPAAPAWRAIYPRFRVFSDPDVLPLMPEAFVPIFTSIRLPAAKSDIARFFLLRAHGGLYVDAHVAPTAPSDLMATLSRLEDRHLLLFGKGWLLPEQGGFDLMNGVLAARQGAPELDRVLDRQMRNLRDHWAKERATGDHVGYDLFALTGTGVVVDEFFDWSPSPPRLKPAARDRVFVHVMPNNTDSGFELYSGYRYRKPNQHWSESQLRERLFLDAA